MAITETEQDEVLQSNANEKYNFSVSCKDVDCVIYMGQIFALLAPKDSISSKYRGYELTADVP